ncbi:MAG: OprD family outer membrane porin [Rubrivivax sp.]
MDDGEVLLHRRSYYFDRHQPGPVVNAAWAAGGWLAYTSGWFGERLRVGAVAYTSQPIWAPDDTPGSLLLGPDQQALSVIGQAYVSLKLAEQVLTGGRFEVAQPEVNPNDIRMIPNTFEGGNLSGQIGNFGHVGATGIGYYAAYLNEMKTIASANFVNFATVAGAPDGVSSPLWLLGFEAAPVADSKVRLSSYYVPDILTSNYADGTWLTTLSPSYKLRLCAQAMYQRSNGSNALTGSSFGTGVGGAKVDLIAGPATFTMAYNQTGRGANYQTPYGGWAGYTFMIVQAFNRAGEKALLFGGSYDFAGVGLPGLALNAYIVNGRQ